MITKEVDIAHAILQETRTKNKYAECTFLLTIDNIKTEETINENNNISIEKSQVMTNINRQNIDASKKQLWNIDNQYRNNLSDLDQEFDPFQAHIQKIKTKPTLTPKKLPDKLLDAGTKILSYQTLTMPN